MLDIHVRGFRPAEPEGVPECLRDGGSVVIMCSGCRLRPEPSSPECVGCMVRCLSRHGGADRVVLRTGTDLEISGRACRMLAEAASLMSRTSGPIVPDGRRCRGCGSSMGRVMGVFWSGFPGDGSQAARALLPQDPEGECVECAMRTSRAIAAAEEGLARIADVQGVVG